MVGMLQMMPRQEVKERAMRAAANVLRNGWSVVREGGCCEWSQGYARTADSLLSDDNGEAR